MAEEKAVSPHSRAAMSSAERAAAMRAELYMTHKVRGSLGTYYQMYPDERPKRALRFYEQDHDQDHSPDR